MPDVAVELTNVGRTYESGSQALAAAHDVTLSIGTAEAVAVTGPSGSGKTTLLNLIGGLDRPTTGAVTVLGTDISALSEAKLTEFRARNIGFVFQDPHLLPGLTALENVVVARLPWGKRKALEPEARKLLTALGLADRIDHPPSRLSGGERQRVGIARALLGQPRVLLADEPTGNLDSRTTEEILDLLTELREDLHLTMVIATHDPAVASVATRVIRLAGGAVVGDLDAPRDQAVDVRTLA